ncbi:GNAT family protein [Actinomadura sp. GC306]|uniref:GNAT family N-acetyltransferase n=1 Tax=Actinomadura sp. GC306 TaxID=2530367 RepID=UPI001A9EB7FB|nr:GNAT family protein [Actinomadura sp. GC306]
MVTTPRLVLRSPTMWELRLVLALGSDGEAQRRLHWAPEDVIPEDERERLVTAPVGRGRGRFGLPGPGLEAALLAIDPALGLPAGAVTLTPESRDRCELGGYLAPSYRGRGLGAELFAAGLALAQHHLHITEVRAAVEPANTACVRALWRAGFDPAAGPEKYVLPDGHVLPSAWFADVTPQPAWCEGTW